MDKTERGSELYRRFRDEGDEDALASLIVEYRDGVIYFVNSIVSDLSAAEELAEDVFVLLGTKKPRDKGKASFKTWLYTIARNTALNHLRSKKPTVPVDDALGIDDPEAELEQLYLHKERRLILHRAMKNLKAEHRQALSLVYFEDMTAAQAAAVLGIKVHAAESLLSRARGALKKELEKEGYGYEDL